MAADDTCCSYLFAFSAACQRVHRAYMACIKAGRRPGAILTFLERTRAYSANEEFIGDHENGTGGTHGHR